MLAKGQGATATIVAGPVQDTWWPATGEEPPGMLSHGK